MARAVLVETAVNEKKNNYITRLIINNQLACKHRHVLMMMVMLCKVDDDDAGRLSYDGGDDAMRLPCDDDDGAFCQMLRWW